MAILGENHDASNGDDLIKTESAKVEEEVDAGRNDASQTTTSPPPLTRAATIPRLSNSPSAFNSPKSSREPSPTRPPLKPGISEGLRGLRSRKNSTDLSPTRPSSASHIPTIPSAAAIQRAFSVAGSPQLQPSVASESFIDVPKPQRPNKVTAGGSGQQGLNVSRVKSPPPPAISNKQSITPLRKTEKGPLTPSIVLERATPIATSITQTDGVEEEPVTERPGMRTPIRGLSASGPTLETVQESSLPATPAIGIGRAHSGARGGPDDRPERIDENPVEDAFGKEAQSRPESGSESGGNKTAGVKNENNGLKKAAAVSTSAKPHIVHPKKSFTQLVPAKSKTGSESTVKSMTVETETVSSIPQVALGGGAGERSIPGRTDTGGSLRLKPSTETIRPKKEKKKVVRKAPSINSGTGGFQFRHFHHHHIHARPPSPTISFSISTPEFASGFSMKHSQTEPNVRTNKPEDKLISSKLGQSPSTPLSPSSLTLTMFRVRAASSKADIFEAKVASAVDQTNSSDSEETFVYESNPPEPHSARHPRFHSRTPSATSTASQIDPYGARARAEGHHGVAGKKSMKFTNNPYNATDTGEEGTVRGPNHSRRTTGSNTTHHHIGRPGRGGHISLFDQESPFPGAAKPSRSATSNVAQLHSRPPSPRSPHVLRIPGSGKKVKEPLLYDLEGEGADDERTPLIRSSQSGRARMRRPISRSSRHSQNIEKEHRFCRRVTVCVALGSLVALLIAAVVVALILCSQPLLDVYVKDIQNVLASEQEIMLDLNVHAMNPNLVAVQVSDLDVNIFAKSKHVGTGQLWRDQHPYRNIAWASSDPTYHTTDDSPSDPPLPDPETDSQTMLLGRIFEFDSPLIFEPSPLRRNSLSSTGEVRLAKPGNKTEEGGSERWEKVLLYEFELIVRGVMRYSSPLGTNTRSASIGGSVLVKPGEGAKAGSNMILDGFRGTRGRGLRVEFVA